MPRATTNDWNVIINAFMFKVQNSPEFFNYFNVEEEEALQLAIRRSRGYLIESLSRLTSQTSSSGVDWHDYDNQLDKFNFDITYEEVDLIANLMYEMFLVKDTAKLRVHAQLLTSQDIKSVYGVGHAERRSFMEMVDRIKHDNNVLIDSYASRDRLTGQRKSIEFDN